MKPLVLGILSTFLLAPSLLRAQTVATGGAEKKIEDLKNKYKNGQKPEGDPRASGPEGKPVEMGAADIEALLLRSPQCSKKAEDAALVAANLKGQYGIVRCADPIDGLRAIVIVPKSDAKNQQLVFASIPASPRADGGMDRGHKLVGARLVDHYLVLQFNTQVQYLDLLKKDTANSAEGAYVLSGFVADERTDYFTNIVIFQDALKTYLGVTDPELFAKLPKAAAEAAKGNPQRLSAQRVNGAWVILGTSNGETYKLWPKPTTP